MKAALLPASHKRLGCDVAPGELLIDVNARLSREIRNGSADALAGMIFHAISRIGIEVLIEEMTRYFMRGDDDMRRRASLLVSVSADAVTTLGQYAAD